LALAVEIPVSAGGGARASVLDAYEQRLPAIRRQIPAVTAAAEAAAELVLAEPRTSLVATTFPGAVEFANELLSRAGGLAKALSAFQPRLTGVDKAVVLVSVRCWQQDQAAVIPRLEEYRRRGYCAIVFGSRAGCPVEAVGDHLVDNGAPDAGADSGPVNIIANVTLGWMWCCEYAAALSRKGKYPGILKSIALQGASENNARFQNAEGRVWLGDTDDAVPAGHLSDLYLQRLDRLVADLRSPRIQGAVSNAADIVAARLRDGRTVQLSGMGHIVNYEMLRDDLKAAFKACRSEKLGDGLAEGDLAVWIGYMGNVGLIKTGGVDRLSLLMEAGVQMVLCEAPMPEAGNTDPGTLAEVLPDRLIPLPARSSVIATVDQCWSMPDAEVPIPWEPGRMAPVSGISALLLLRMLDEQVASRISDADRNSEGSER
jgi:uncharacterized phosphosugar-binding protein